MFGCGVVPGVGVGSDDALGRFFELAEEEPVPPAGGEVGVAACECFADRNCVEDRELVDGCRVVERGTQRDVCAAVVSDDGERSWPSARISSMQSRAIARLEYGS